MLSRAGLVLAATLAALSVTTAPALADGTRCSTMTTSQFERLGSSVMARMAGSPGAYTAMTDRMDAVLGTQATDRMEQLMGRRYAGCATGVAIGPGMMGAPAYRWMSDGRWRHMTGSDWRDVATSMMGARYMSSGHSWNAAAVVAVVLGALLVGALAAVLLVRRPWRNQPPPPSAPTRSTTTSTR